jgi:predicted nucleic acid-binding protein
VRYWDTSAILPLLVDEPNSAAMVALLRDDPAVVVWWSTSVECWSVLARLERERRLSDDGVRAAAALLTEAMDRWTEVPPISRVRNQATRLVRTLPLRAADALQLAAALAFCDFEPKTLPFVTLDDRLAGAARREGFEVLGT